MATLRHYLLLFAQRLELQGGVEEEISACTQRIADAFEGLDQRITLIEAQQMNQSTSRPTSDER